MRLTSIVVPGLLFAAAACASSGSQSATNIDASLLATGAERRVVSNDTTWVVRGLGYELVARSSRDLAQLKPALDAQAQAMRDVFGADPGKVVAVVRRVSRDGKSTSPSPPTPTAGETIVEATITEQPSPNDSRGFPGGRTPPPEMVAKIGMVGRLGAGTPTQNIVRAWLAGRAREISSQPAGSGTGVTGRVPHWAEDAIAGLAADSQVSDLMAAQLSAQKDSMYSLGEFLVMHRPPYVQPAVPGGMEGRPGGMGGRGRGGIGGGGGGRGGMGGMGRGGRGGGMPGGASERATRSMVLQGSALFTAQAMVFSRYAASRESPRFLGSLIDAQMKGAPIKSVFERATKMPNDLDGVELDWQQWVGVRGRNARR